MEERNTTPFHLRKEDSSSSASNENLSSLNKENQSITKYLRIKDDMKNIGEPKRNLEDVDYWRHRAGWFDDDEAMKQYNEGVYDTFYSTTDDDRFASSSSSSKTSSKLSTFFGSGEIVTTSIKVFAGIIGVAVFVLLVRAVRRVSQSRKKSTRKISNLSTASAKRPSSRSRSRSKSKMRSRSSRSRSRRRKSRNEDNGKDYSLMEDGEGTKSLRSSKSKSRDKSRTRSSRSRSRARRQESSGRETMLV